MERLSGGQVVRSWVYLFADFTLGTLYFTLLSALYSTAFSTLIVLIGFPLLVFSFAATRGLANFDRGISAALLNRPMTPMVEELDLRGMNIWQRLGAYASSPRTWLSAFYLFVKFPMGLLSLTVASMLLPFALIEWLLWLIGIDMGNITGRLAHWMAVFSFSVGDALMNTNLPTQAYADEKPKNDLHAGRTVQVRRLIDDDEPTALINYALTDDGEIVPLYEDDKPKRR